MPGRKKTVISTKTVYIGQLVSMAVFAVCYFLVNCDIVILSYLYDHLYYLHNAYNTPTSVYRTVVICLSQQ